MKAPVAVLYANLKGNVGDFAILHATLLQLNKLFPGHPIHVFPHDFLPIDKKRLEAFRVSGAPAFELKNWTYSKQFPENLKGFRQIGLGSFLQAWFVRHLTNEAKKEAVQFAAYKAVFVSGGAQWADNAGNAMFAGINAIGQLNTPIFTFPFSIQPKVIEIHSRKYLKKYFHNLQTPLYVRDSNSKEVIDSLGIDSVHVSDCVLSLKNLAPSIVSASDVNSERILLTLTKDKENLYETLCALIPNLLKSNYKVELLMTSPGDRELYKKVSKEFSVPHISPLTWQEAVAHFKSSSLLITNRLHGVIFGMLAEVPILPVVNRAKTRAVVHDAKLPFSAREPQDISIDLIREVKANGKLILDAMIDYRNRSRGEISLRCEQYAA